MFNTEMVRAILDGRKTQTRRVIKPEWSRCLDLEDPDDARKAMEQCPYGQPGDQLWVRETYTPKSLPEVKNCDVIYKANFNTSDGFGSEIIDFNTGELTPLIWYPSIFMPRWASRITLEVVKVRVERVQEISEEDAICEGIYPLLAITPFIRIKKFAAPGIMATNVYGEHDDLRFSTATDAFKELWNSINAKRGCEWDVNPWVWVIEFKRIKK
jgi:hypothetical protein